MMNFLYRSLPIVFGCHCRADRSFFFHGKQFPICARCTGELAGMVIVTITYAIYRLPILYAIGFLIPMAFDGGLQLLTAYESTNFKRFFTGILFGYGFFDLLIMSAVATYRYGYNFL
ncbi:MAG: DUF2085 domain-containing protein [Lacrimispora sp.]|uniref:DUF2085 domain-containing protein n=1 Tax=Lacrimispora sp. TaxID=2719234 RepID=UPI0039E29FFC